MKSKNVEKVLVTGGLGFVGSHTVDLLVTTGYEVTVIDNLEKQVHGEKQQIPNYHNKNVNYVCEDILSKNLLKTYLQETDAVIHLAAMVGVGQSMYQIERYVDVNTRATSKLLDLIVNTNNSIKKIIVASSMSIYGEGLYKCEKCSINLYPTLRKKSDLNQGRWGHLCSHCNSSLSPIPTTEDKPLLPTSIYAMTKRHQEEMCLLIGKTYNIPTVALRYFNIYGSRQALSNPYTGCVAIFTSRILNNNSPYIFEDGNQTRDFIHVSDLAQANVKALEKSNANYNVINVGTGNPIKIKELSDLLINLYHKNIKTHISNEYRNGDIRHCYADITKAKKLLDFDPKVKLEKGLSELESWVEDNKSTARDLFENSLQELKSRNLT